MVEVSGFNVIAMVGEKPAQILLPGDHRDVDRIERSEIDASVFQRIRSASGCHYLLCTF